MPLSPLVAEFAVRSKVVVLLLLTFCLSLLPLWESVIVLCFVVCYFMSILVLQSSWWGRESWLLCLICLSGVLRWLSGSSCGAMELSAVCDCCISWSYSLTIYDHVLNKLNFHIFALLLSGPTGFTYWIYFALVSILFSGVSLSLLYLFFISWFMWSRRLCIGMLGIFHANETYMCLDPHLN